MSGTDTHGGALAKIWLTLLGLVIFLAGLVFTVGGAKLASLGGSHYFVIAGLALLASGLFIARRRTLGGQIFFATFAATIVWRSGKRDLRSGR